MVLRDEATLIAMPGGKMSGGKMPGAKGAGGKGTANNRTGTRETHEDGWIGAAVLFAVAAITAIVLLSNDRPRSHMADELSLPEGKRMMVMAPLPRN